MNNNQLINAIREETASSVSRRDIGAVLTGLQAVIHKGVRSGRVLIPGLGTFRLTTRKATTYNNPLGGPPVEKPERRVLAMKPAKHLMPD